MNGNTVTLSLFVSLTLAHVLTAAELRQTEITVAEMHCKGCAQKIAARLYLVPGVKSVSVDVNRKTLFVVAQQEKTLSPRLLCEAVEKVENHAKRLAGPFGTILIEYPVKSDDRKPQSRPAIIVVEEMDCKACAQKIAAKLYLVPDVKSVSVSVDKKTLFVTPAQGRQLSLWALWDAVEKAENRALEIRGPAGVLKRTKTAIGQRTAGHVVR